MASTAPFDQATYDKDQWRQNELVITTAVFTSLSVLIRKFGLDDACILVALFFAVGYLAEIMVGRANHMGHTMDLLTLDNMLNIIKVPTSF